MFLGPRRNGTSLETGLNLDWADSDPPVLWERPMGEGYGAPVTANGKLVLFHRVDNHEVIECVDPEDGTKVIWKYQYPTRLGLGARIRGGNVVDAPAATPRGFRCRNK